MTPRSLASALLFGLSAAAAPAQVGAGEVGLLLSAPSGAVGTLCPSEFSCTFLDGTLVRGENVDVVVRGVYGRPFAVFLGAPQPPTCLRLPGVHNAAVMIPAVVPFAGVLDQWDSILACPGGSKRLGFSVPANVPAGAQVLFQGVAWSYLLPSEVPTFTAAIRVTIG